MNSVNIQNMVDHFAKEIGDQLSHYAPAAWKTMLAVKQADCIGALVTNLTQAALLTILALVIFRFAWGCFKFAKAQDDAPSHRDRDLTWPGLPAYIATIICSGLGVTAFWTACSAFSAVAFDQWVWIGAFHPSLAVAHDIINAVFTQQAQQ